MTTGLSYAQGSTAQPLMRLTIGQALRQAAERFPDNEAIVSLHQSQRISYATLDRQADRVASALLAMGVSRGDRVAIWSPNNAEWLIAQYGAVRIGAIVVTVNPALRDEEARYVLADSDCSVVFAAPAFRDFSFAEALGRIRGQLPSLRHIVYLSDHPAEGGLSWTGFLQQATPRQQLNEAEAEARCEDPCSLQYTSGTTGRPKGALLTHYNILNNGHCVGERQLLTPKDRICLPVPFFHCFGLVLGALAAVTHASTIVLPGESFDAKATLDSIARERCTSLYGVPMMFISLLSHPEIATTDLSTLRTGAMGGAPCPIEVMRQAVDTMNVKQITVVYGMTETSPISFQSLADDSNEIRVTTVGQIHSHLEAKVIGDKGQTLEIGKTGELCVRGYSVMQGYWRNPEATREAIDEEGWMHTGDLAVMMPDNYLQIVGRMKNTIIRGGENIYPREIEEFLLTLPDIAEAYIFGLPDPTYGEEVCAWIRLRSGAHLSGEEVRGRCKGKIATFKIPRYIRLVESFPCTASGKVQYFKMREAELSIREGTAASA
jgi:fatty-acyl-CoA synthase